MKLELFQVWDDSEAAIRDWDSCIPGLDCREPLKTRLARAIYLPERPGEGKRNAVERRHNIIIADKTGFVVLSYNGLHYVNIALV
jgi:hypothetical protein